MRLKEVNPVDILKDTPVDLTGKNYYLLAGDNDDFNHDAQLLVIKPLLTKAGAGISPENPIIPGGRHNWKTVSPFMNDIFVWIDSHLQPE